MRLLPLLTLLVVGVALWATSASADVSATGRPAGHGCTEWILCNDQVSTGTCDEDLNGVAGDEYYLRPTDEYYWTAYTQDSDSTADYTVKLYSTSQGLGFDTDHRVLINSSGDITFDNPMFSWTGLMGDIHAVLGGTTTDGVTLKVKGCKVAGP